MSKYTKEDVRKALGVIGEVALGILDGLQAMEEGSSLPVAVGKAIKNRQKPMSTSSKKHAVCADCGGRHVANLDCQGTNTFDARVTR